MSDEIAQLQNAIAEREAYLQQHPSLPDFARTLIEAELAQKRAELARLTGTDQQSQAKHDTSTGTATASGGTVYGPLVGVNLGKIIYGRDPDEDERRRLVRYLDRVQHRYGMISLRGIPSAKKALEQVDLAKIYTSLATTNRVVLDRGTKAQLERYFVEDIEKIPQPSTINSESNKNNPFRPYRNDRVLPKFQPDSALPEDAVLEVIRPHAEDRAELYQRSSFFGALLGKKAAVPANVQADEFVLLRAERAVEAMFKQAYCVVVGDPGSGKSVLLRFVAWDCAQRNLDPSANPFNAFPVFLPLRMLAGALATKPATTSSTAVILRLIEDQAINDLGSDRIDDLLREGLLRGTVLLLLDGLDEVPMQATPAVANRQTVLQALKAFANDYQLHPVRMIVTCRTRAYTPDLAELLKWPVYTLAPFTLGQIRHFLDVFFGEYVQADLIRPDRKAKLEQLLLTAMGNNPKLEDMATSPLLLTLMAQLLYTDGELPRDRPAVYERILELLLDKWESQREQESIATAIGHPAWNSSMVLPLIDQLSFEAHQNYDSKDGRGRLKREIVYTRMVDFFTKYGNQQFNPFTATGNCLAYIDQRSGIFVPDNDADGEYVFAHLTFQEHCAGRYLVLDPECAAEQVMQYRHDDRWHEPIFLGLGVIQDKNPSLINDIVTRLLDQDDAGKPKAPEIWYQDLLFAAAVGHDRDWAKLGTQRVNVANLKPKIARGLVTLLTDANPTLNQQWRIKAGDYLNELGDPRPGVCDLTIQWCEIPAGSYTVGDAKEQQTVTLSDFAIAKYCVTNAQWQVFMDADGYNEPRWWGNYWELRQSEGWTKPRYWDSTDFNMPNQPVVGVSWFEAWAFCNWLSEQLRYRVCLPTEAQWEIAARGIKRPSYPWGDQWHSDYANTNETGLGRTTVVGCYPQGASWCTALDLSGNVGEWTLSDCDNPDRNNQIDIMKNSTFVSFRGGSWIFSPQFARVASRFRFNPRLRYDDLGLRLFRSSSQI